jgi:hypothetical protein
MISLSNTVARDFSWYERPSDASIRALLGPGEQIRGLQGCLLRLCGPGIAPLHRTEE